MTGFGMEIQVSGLRFAVSPSGKGRYILRRTSDESLIVVSP
jgi:hypothetical protein